MKKFVLALTLLFATAVAGAQRYRGSYTYHGYGYPHYGYQYHGWNHYRGPYNYYPGNVYVEQAPPVCQAYDAWGNCYSYQYPYYGPGVGFSLRIR